MRFALAGLLFCLAMPDARAQSAEEVQSWCKPILHAKTLPDGKISFKATQGTSFCWGAFAVVQAFSGMQAGRNTMMIGACVPPATTRLQFIKLFADYVDAHREASRQEFAGVARQSLVDAFPCGRAAAR